MTLKEKFKLSFTLYRREKKQKLYSLIMILCCLLIFTIIVMNTNILQFINSSYKRYDNKIITLNKKISRLDEEEKIIDEILSIEHVTDAYIINSETFGEISLREEIKMPTSLYRRLPINLPPIVKGRKYNENENNTIICPINYTLIDENQRIKTFKLQDYLNEDVEFTFHRYANLIFDREEEEQHYKFKLIGLYDSRTEFLEGNTCFINSSDNEKLYNNEFSIVHQLEEKENNNNLPYSTIFNIVVDDIKNVKDVKSSLKKYAEDENYIDDFAPEVDAPTIKKIVYSEIVIITISIFTIVKILISNSKKKLLKNKNNILVMKTFGFSIKTISTIYALETFIKNTIIYLLSTLFIVVVMYIGINKIDTLVYLNQMSKIGVSLNDFIITFIIMVLIPTFLSYRIIKKKI